MVASHNDVGDLVKDLKYKLGDKQCGMEFHLVDFVLKTVSRNGIKVVLYSGIAIYSTMMTVVSTLLYMARVYLVYDS